MLSPEELPMFVIAEAATTLVRLRGRFDSPQARSIEEMFSMFRPLPHVIIDFADVREIDDAAVVSLARTLGAFPESRVTFRGLSRHVRRVLRYLGVSFDAPYCGVPGPAAVVG
jgi:anti-anti-sigma regulatory factor